MKSILVDALRQAKEDDADQALSDSGSFDASQDALAPPANDTIEESHGELELMSTTNALIVREESAQDPGESTEVDQTREALQDLEADASPVAYEPVDDEHAMTVAGMMPLPVTQRQMPWLARLAPLLCAALAITVAASWLLINKLGVSSASLGPTVTQENSANPNDLASGDTDRASRFPFLEGDGPSTAGETGQ